MGDPLPYSVKPYSLINRTAVKEMGVRFHDTNVMKLLKVYSEKDWIDFEIY